MSLLRRALACLGATAVLLTLAGPAAAGAPAVEGEHMPTVAGRTSVVPGGAATAGRARALPAGAAVAVRLHTPTRAGRVVLRLRRGPGLGAPQLAVSLDGRQVAVVAVASRSWTSHALPGHWAPGTYTLGLRRPGSTGPAVLVDRAVFVGGSASAALAPAGGSVALDDAYESRVVQRVNEERARAGVRPLAVSACADSYAEAWSRRMASTGVLAHRDDLGALLRSCRGSRVGENIAYGEVSPDQLVDMWMSSPGHRANMLQPEYTHLGVGASRTGSGRVYATQNFLRLG